MNHSPPLTMRAAVTPAPGARPIIESSLVPQPGPGEVLVQVMTSSVNPTDVMTWRRGAFVTGHAAPFVGGYDMAGVVVAVGRGVTTLAVGDAVAGMPRFPSPAGAFAEYAAVPARHVARLPLDVSALSLADWGRWAGLPLAGLTAYQALVDTAHVRSAQKVLIHAASGGVGHLAIQVAVALGAEVTATTSSRGRALVDTLGAHQILDRNSIDWPRLAGGFDVVLDSVGGEVTPLSLALATPDGMVVTLHPYAHDDLARHDRRLRRMLVEPDQQALRELIALAGDGSLNVHVGANYALHALGDALVHVENSKTPGKTIIHNQGEHA